MRRRVNKFIARERKSQSELLHQLHCVRSFFLATMYKYFKYTHRNFVKATILKRAFSEYVYLFVEQTLFDGNYYFIVIFILIKFYLSLEISLYLRYIIFYEKVFYEKVYEELR